MKLIGAGLPRTATLSHKTAIERLGQGPCYHMVNVLGNLDEVPRWQRAMEDERVLPGVGRVRGDRRLEDRLLVWSITDGWDPLCAFLDVPVPDEPFPWVNDTKEFGERIVRASFSSIQECVTADSAS